MCKHLSGCFLNTPDKMLQDTPLHMACKFNCVDCVELLISHPFCDIYAKNFDKLTPEEVFYFLDKVHSDVDSNAILQD